MDWAHDKARLLTSSYFIVRKPKFTSYQIDVLPAEIGDNTEACACVITKQSQAAPIFVGNIDYRLHLLLGETFALFSVTGEQCTHLGWVSRNQSMAPRNIERNSKCLYGHIASDRSLALARFGKQIGVNVRWRQDGDALFRFLTEVTKKSLYRPLIPLHRSRRVQQMSLFEPISQKFLSRHKRYWFATSNFKNFRDHLSRLRLSKSTGLRLSSYLFVFNCDGQCLLTIETFRRFNAWRAIGSTKFRVPIFRTARAVPMNASHRYPF